MDPNEKEAIEMVLIEFEKEVDSSNQAEERASPTPGGVFDAEVELEDLFGRPLSSASPKPPSPQNPIVEQPLESAAEVQRPQASPARQLFRTGGFSEVVSQPNTIIAKDVPVKFGTNPRGYFDRNVTDDSNNNKSNGMHNGNGFGCSNTEIAKRMSSRGRSSNARRRRGAFRQSTRSISVKRPTNTTTTTTTQANSQPLNENVVLPPIAPTTLGSERPKESNNDPRSPPKSSPSSHKRQLCEKCGRYGHSPQVCYSVAHTSVLRCYNCHKMGHLAARCPMFGPGGRRGRHRATSKPVESIHSNTTSTTSATDSSTTANSQNGSSNSKVEVDDKKKIEIDVTGVEIICKLMQDPHMRKEAMRCTPEIYDEMITVMMQHVKL